MGVAQLNMLAFRRGRGRGAPPGALPWRAATIATDAACSILGRRRVVRASRCVYFRARRDTPNGLYGNGELNLQRWIMNLSAGGRIHVVDAGANVGQWSMAMLDAARRSRRLDDLDLHAFEPSSYTFGCLSEALSEHSLILRQAALGEETGSSVLHVIAPGSSINSLYQLPWAPNGSTTEEVPVTTLDEYADEAKLKHITLVKIDTEGNDMAVLRGAQSLFSAQRISVVQFEYNWMWVCARSFLRDAFELLRPLGYCLGKLTARGIKFYPDWDPDLETFVQSNYVACVAAVAERLPSVSWWKTGENRIGEPG